MAHPFGLPSSPEMLFVLIASVVVTAFAAQSCVDPLGPTTNGLCPSGYTVLGSLCCGSVVTTPDCVDKINTNTGKSDCPGMVSYCTNAAYKAVMTDQCPKTCGFCGGAATTTKAPCVDLINQSTGKSDCPGMTAYCTNPNYVSLMRTQCPKTCGFCTSG